MTISIFNAYLHIPSGLRSMSWTRQTVFGTVCERKVRKLVEKHCKDIKMTAKTILEAIDTLLWKRYSKLSRPGQSS